MYNLCRYEDGDAWEWVRLAKQLQLVSVLVPVW